MCVNVFMHACVYACAYMHVCACVWLLVQACVYLCVPEASFRHWSSGVIHFIFRDRVSHWELGFTDETWLPGSLTSGIFLSQMPQILQVCSTMLSFLHGCWVSNSGSPSCIPSTLRNKLSPLYLFLFPPLSVGVNNGVTTLQAENRVPSP